MASIEESLSLSVAARRRKGTSLGSVSSRSSPKLDAILGHNGIATHPKDQHDREAIMQSLRVQLGLEKAMSGRSSAASVSGPPPESGEKPGNEQKLSRLRNDAENKRNAIRNLKDALNRLEQGASLDIDSRIRQAELEYALGREELQLLSIVEEARAVQGRLEKDRQRADVSSLFAILRNGHQLTLHQVQAATGRWNASQKHDCGDGFYVDWVMEGEELQRGDRIIELNGRILAGKGKDELQKLCAGTNRCDLVVIRKRSVSLVSVVSAASSQQLQQSQADNMRLQHRISYLEEQVKELLDVQKEKSSPVMSSGSQRSGTHITSISISSSPSEHDEDRPVTYQRGAFVTTIVGGKPQNPPPKLQSGVQKSSSTTNINGHHQTREGEKANTPKSVKSLSSSMSKISISTDLHVQRQRREREKKERDRYYNNKNSSKSQQR
jgi:sulfur dioxygenase